MVRFYGEVSREPQGWRGQVEHVQSGEKRAFHGAKELVRAMEGLAQRAGTLELSLKEQEE
ncbi:hypothetical protein HYR54_04030 [Candidatus Acetothermia bacterium]|nr:hypothetical protein [Candidatus Acetothermia bacterium]